MFNAMVGLHFLSLSRQLAPSVVDWSWGFLEIPGEPAYLGGLFFFAALVVTMRAKVCLSVYVYLNTDLCIHSTWSVSGCRTPLVRFV